LISRAAVDRDKEYIMRKALAKVTVVAWLATVFLASYSAGTQIHAGAGRNYGYAYVGNSNSTGVYVGKVNSGVLLAGYGCEVWLDHLSADCFRQGS
jgi:hypothetical protein